MTDGDYEPRRPFEARHEGRHDLDDQYDLQQEQRHDRRDRAAVVTRKDVAGLIASVGDLEDAIDALNGRLDRQWRAGNRKRRRTAWVLVVFTVGWAYAVGAMIDQHAKNCMTFGGVPDERIKTICDVTVPFHDHPIGGISDEVLEDMVERAQRVRGR